MMETKEIYFERNGVIIEGTVYIIPANPTEGYNCGYAIFVPKNCNKDTTLFMHCSTVDNVPIHLSEAEDIIKKSSYERPHPGIRLGNTFCAPVIIPLIPRIRGYYTQSLTSKVYENDVSVLVSENEKRPDDMKLSNEELSEIQSKCYDLPHQVVNMIKSSKSFLQSMGINVEDKIIIEGYSAGAQFANYFTALYPKLIRACICGGNAGLGILPIEDYRCQQLQYPLGIANMPKFDYDNFCRVPQLYYMGTDDYSDPAIAECKYQVDSKGQYILDNGIRIPQLDKDGNLMYITDNKGKLIPQYPECFSQEEIEVIYKVLGSNPQIRFANQRKVYNYLGVNATFKRFVGNHRTIGSSLAVEECINKFIRENMPAYKIGNEYKK